METISTAWMKYLYNWQMFQEKKKKNPNHIVHFSVATYNTAKKKKNEDSL